MAAFPHLLSPLDIGPFTLRNRMISTGHNPHYDTDGLIGDGQIAFHERKAKGGIALSTVGATTVHPSGGVWPVVPLINFDDSVLPGYRRLADAMHAQGARMMIQLVHGGGASLSAHIGPPIWAPSAVTSVHSREWPHVMTIPEIETVLHAFHEAAARVRKSGLDGVEINMFAGGLPQQFMSPRYNKRTDKYGGSFENRMRFVIELVRTVRAALGDECALALKISGDEGFEGGLRLADMQRIVATIDAEALINYYVVASGNNMEWMPRVDHWPPAPASHEWFVDLATKIKSATKRPVAALGRITRPEIGEELLAKGGADIVAIVRATIADPDFPKKLAEGNASQIRPCVGANSGCADRIAAHGEARCIHNPIIGHEREWSSLDPVSEPRKVVVVGGGPGGLEAARVAALRGHKVVLFESRTELGGSVGVIAKKPGRASFSAIASWLVEQVKAAGVDVRLGTPATVDAIAALEPDVVVLATGAEVLRPDLEGTAASPQIVSVYELLDGRVEPGKNVVVMDSLGADHGAAAAELVHDRGGKAELVTPYFHPAMDFGLTNTLTLYRRLFQKGVTMTPHHRVERAEDGGAVIANIYTGETSVRGSVDQIVIATPRRARDELRDALATASIETVMIGDCIAPRDVETAIYEAHKAARAI